MDARRKLAHSQSTPLESGKKSWLRSHSDGDWKDAWKGAVRKAREAKDPWAKQNIVESCKTEKALRYRYNAFEKKWVRDEIEVKMQSEVFGKGAMRKCFRTKKLSTFTHNQDWNHAGNYVAKRYIDEVDIFQVYIIEMTEREDSPLFHFEHFIEGNYVKYNSNSGFVLADENFRMTPQAFSHFTFERSGHHLIVVDIQGVGDLYTDPQIHTACGSDYGEANLGAKGMALFFGSHKCNKICKDLGLVEFDLSPLEIQRIDQFINTADPSTKLRGTVHTSRRKMSAMFGLVDRLSDHPSSSHSSSSDESDSCCSQSQSIEDMSSPRSFGGSSCGSLQEHDGPGLDAYFARFKRKISSVPQMMCDNVFQMEAESLFDSAPKHPEIKQCRDSGIEEIFEMQHESHMEELEKMETPNLGLVHLELVTMNQVGRLSEEQPDMASAFFHLETAASCGLVEANREIGKIYLQLPHGILEDFNVEESAFNYNKGISYILTAAKEEDKDSILIAAKAFDSGERLGDRDRSWPEAVHWYEEALRLSGTDYGGLDDDPAYKIYARLAEMYREGGYGLDKDANRSGELYNDAAEAAMNAMKGKMANKYYMLAEEVWGEIEE